MSEEIYDCDVCQRTFKNKAGLFSHQKTHETDTALNIREPLPVQHIEIPVTVLPPDPDVVEVWPDKGDTNAVSFVSTPSLNGTPTAYAPVIKIKKLSHYRDLPDLKKGTVGSAAYDLYAAITKDIIIPISTWVLIPTGLCMEIPQGWWGMCAPRSGLAANDGITVLNSPGVIDSDYRGEIKVNLINNTTKKFIVKPGMRICQMMFQKVYDVKFEEVEELSDTARGTGGFGSTGVY